MPELDGFFKPFPMDDEANAQAEARRILDAALELNKRGYEKIGMTCPVNGEGAVKAVQRVYEAGKWETGISGDVKPLNVVPQIEALLQEEKYKDLQGVFRIVPINAHWPENSINDDMRRVTNFAEKPKQVVLGLQDLRNKEIQDGSYAILVSKDEEAFKRELRTKLQTNLEELAKKRPEHTVTSKEQEEKRRREEEQKRWEQLDFANNYSIRQGIPRWRRVDAPDEETQEEKANPGLTHPSLRSKLLKDGVYEQAGKKGFQIRVRDGSAYPIPMIFPFSYKIRGRGWRIPWTMKYGYIKNPLKTFKKDFKAGYSRAIDLVASGQGVNVININWAASTMVNELQLRLLLDLIDEKGLAVEYGSQVVKYLETLPDRKRKYYYERQQRLAANAGKTPLLQVENFKHKADILKETASEDAKKAFEQKLRDAEPQAKADLIEKELASNEERLEELQGIHNVVKGHLDREEAAIADAKKADELKGLKTIHTANSEALKALLLEIEKEKKDLEVRQTILESTMDDVKKGLADEIENIESGSAMHQLFDEDKGSQLSEKEVEQTKTKLEMLKGASKKLENLANVSKEISEDVSKISTAVLAKQAEALHEKLEEKREQLTGEKRETPRLK